MIPLPWRSSRSRSKRGYLRYWPSRLASEEIRNRLCRPSLFSAEQGHVRVVDLALGRALVADVLADVGTERERRAVEAGPDRDVVALHADDRLHPGGLAGLPELVGTEQVAVVGDRQRRHLHPGGLGEELLDPGRTVEHRVLGVGVQVHEVTTGAVRHRCPPGACHEPSTAPRTWRGKAGSGRGRSVPPGPDIPDAATPGTCGCQHDRPCPSCAR